MTVKVVLGPSIAAGVRGCESKCAQVGIAHGPRGSRRGDTHILSLCVICEPLAWAEEPCPHKNPVHLGCLSRPTLQGGLEAGLGAGQLPESKGAMSRGDPGPPFYWGPVRLLLCLLGCGAALRSGARAAGTRPGGREGRHG